MRIIRKQQPNKNTTKYGDDFLSVYNSLCKGVPVKDLAETVMENTTGITKCCPFCGKPPVKEGKNGKASISCNNPLCGIRPQTSAGDNTDVTLAWSLFVELMNALRYAWNDWPINGMKHKDTIALIEALMGNMKVDVVTKRDNDAFERWLDNGAE